MISDINLISQDLSTSSKESKAFKRLRLIATLSISVVASLSIFLFLLNHVFLSPSSIIKQQNAIIENLSSLSGKQAKLIILNQRLNDISLLLKKRTNYDLAIDSILQQAPLDIVTTSLSVEKGKVSMIVSSDSLHSVDSFINGLKSMVAKKQFIKNITVDNLIFNSKDSSYSLTFRTDLL